MTYALDSNIISYLLREEGIVDKYFQQEIIEAGNSYVIPPMAVYELRRWLLDKPTRQMKIFSGQFNVLLQPVKSKAEISIDLWEKSAEIYILIAAYCMVNDYTLVTRNISDFKRIDGLKFVNWFE